MTPANIEAEYVEWKMVKTRKALQLIFELPLEHQAAVQSALGTPLPGESRWVVIVPFVKTQREPAILPPPANDDAEDKPRPLSQIAALLSTKVLFRRFLEELGGITISGEIEATHELRKRCQVNSRKELDTNPEAAQRFRDLRADYNNWLRGQVPA